MYKVFIFVICINLIEGLYSNVDVIIKQLLAAYGSTLVGHEAIPGCKANRQVEKSILRSVKLQSLFAKL